MRGIYHFREGREEGREGGKRRRMVWCVGLIGKEGGREED